MDRQQQREYFGCVEWVQGDRKLGRAEIQYGFGCGDRGVRSKKLQPDVSTGVVKLVYDL